MVFAYQITILHKSRIEHVKYNQIIPTNFHFYALCQQ